MGSVGACRAKSLAFTVALAPLMIGGAPASAQSDEIVVTAQKREQTLIDVPAAVSAFGSERIKEQNLPSIAAIATLVPNFVVQYERGPASTPSMSIRGIAGDRGNSRLNESSVAAYQDEVYLGDESMLTGGVYDIERVEVLRGPQGTLFGRNTTGGLVHYLSAAPTTDFSGYATALYGSDNWTSLEGAVSGSLSNRVRVRAAGMWDRTDGHYRNTISLPGVSRKQGARDVWGLRGTVDIDLSENTLFRFIASHSENHSESVNGRSPGVLDPATGALCSLERVLDGKCVSSVQFALKIPGHGYREPGTTATNLTNDQLAIEQRTNSFTGKLTSEWDWATLTSITNFSNTRFSVGLDADQGPDDIGTGYNIYALFKNREHQFSEEARLNGTVDGKHNWVVGGFYYSDQKQSNMLVDSLTVFNIPFNFRATSSAAVKTRALAAFGQIDLKIDDTVTLTVGARYSDEHRNLTRAKAGIGSAVTGAQIFDDVLADMLAFGFDPRVHTKDLTGKIGVTWEPSPNHTLYLNYSRGAKSAGYNTFFSSSPADFGFNNAASVGPVGQEKLDAVEFGLKNRLFDRKLSINSALFYYDFDGKQQILYVAQGPTATILPKFLNVGTVHLAGAETEISFAPSPRWNFNLNGGYLWNKIAKSDVVTPNPFGVLTPLQGKRLQQTPKWTFNAIAAYHLPTDRLGEFTFQGEWNGVAKQNYSITNSPLVADRAHVVTNLRLLWQAPDNRFNAQVFVTNVFKTNYYLSVLDAVLDPAKGGFLVGPENEGRVWGVKVGATF